VEGLTIGALATELGMSKSGLFAHFGSKEDLQIEVLRAAAERFELNVVRPAISAPRGEPRVKKLFENWFKWVSGSISAGGCIFVGAAAELDDREGKPRDFLAGTQRQLLETIGRAARIAVEQGHFRPELDCDQFAYDLMGIMLSLHHVRRLLRDPKADARARNAFDRLLQSSRSPKRKE
jgi:AcrR family transcriptional regulator